MPLLAEIIAFWPFASAGMLLWALAAAIPIIIHLLSKRKYQEVPWAAVKFLLAAVQKNARRVRVEQLLLLLVRVMILVLLALALADPIVSGLSQLGSSGTRGQNHYVLVIDASYSMAYTESGESRFEAARRMARELVDSSVQGDGFTLVLMSNPPRVVIAEPTSDKRNVLSEIDGLELLHTDARLEQTLAEVASIVTKAKRDYPRLPVTKVCLFSDLGQNTWSEVGSPECRQITSELAEQASLVLLDLGNDTAANRAVVRLQSSESLASIGRELTFRAELQDFNQSASGHLVDWYVDDRPMAQSSVSGSSDGHAQADFRYRFETPGEHIVEARLQHDSLTVDDHRWLSVPVRESIRVLCIEGRFEAARHVAIALAPEESINRVQVDVKPEGALLELATDDYDCIFLCNVGRFGSEEAFVLNAYLKKGGGVVVFPGDQVQPESYNESLAGKVQVLPARLGALNDDSQYAFDPLDYRHPIIAPFRGHERSGLLTTPVWTYYRLEPLHREHSVVALAFNNGDPAMVTATIERGRSILFATAASPNSLNRNVQPPTPWTAFSTWPSFPPLIQETLIFAISGRAESRNGIVGQPLEAYAPPQAANAPVTIIGPSGQKEKVRLMHSPNGSRWSFPNTLSSGVYEAEYVSGSDKQWYAVNVDTAESDLTRFDPQLLPNQFVREVNAGEAGGTALPVSGRSELFRYLLFGVLGLVLTETFLGWFFGSRR